jgi:hypothetical protein
MSKTVTRLRKVKKDYRNIVVIGDDFSDIDDLAGYVKTIFVIGLSKDPIKKKNIIYLENYSFLNSVPDIDLVMLSKDKTHDVKYFQNSLIKWKPIIFMNSRSLITTEEAEPLKKIKYFMIENHKNTYIWKQIK